MRPSTRHLALTGTLVIAVALLAACGRTTETAGGRLQVVATTTQIGDFAREVGGGRVAVTQLLRPNTDPHEYEPTPRDVEAVSAARVVLEHGLGLDDWLAPVLANAGGSASRVVTTAAIATLPGGDPHVWLDPDNAKLMVAAVERALAAADASGAPTYRANAAALTKRITALDGELRKRIGTIPPARRKIVTDHEAFQYFARHYGIDIVGATLPSLSTGAQSSAAQIAALVATMRTEHVRVVFPEASSDPRLERALADEAEAKLGAPLYGDALGPEGSPAGTYLGMMRTNMDAIVAGLGSP